MAEQTPAQLTRQQLYDRIRASSKDEVVLAEMKRLGFWPADEDQPQPSEQLIRRQGELERELHELLVRQRRLDNPEQALRDMHKQRKREAMAKREETRKRHARQSFEQAQNWQDCNQRELTHLGDVGSGNLQEVAANQARLKNHDLPLIESHLDLAKAMGIELSELRFLAYSRDVSKISHYRQFKIAKKSGGHRLISAPMPRLKRAQYWILANILEKIPVSEQAQGFVRGRSIVSNAKLHIQSKVVINVDLKDFFPTVDYRRVKGIFTGLGYGEAIAAVLALIATGAETETVTLDGETFHIAQGERRLPQGAPTSPALTNILCWRLDKRLFGAAKALGFKYSRYADDLTFSTKTAEKPAVSQLLWRVRQIVRAEGFKLHPDKTRVMYRHKRQEVTGIVVNDKPSLERQTLKRFRALLFQIDKDGPQGKTWGDAPLFPAIEGFANYVAMVSPEKGLPLQQTVARLKQRYGISVKPGRIQALNRKLFKLRAAQGLPPREHWWTPAPRVQPVRQKTDLERQTERKQQRAAAKAEQPPSPASSVETPDPDAMTRRASLKPVDNPDPGSGNIYLWILLVFIAAYLLKTYVLT